MTARQIVPPFRLQRYEKSCIFVGFNENEKISGHSVPARRRGFLRHDQGTGIQGENLDMWTIDIPGNSGYNPWPIDESPYYSIGDEMPNTGTNYLSYTGYFGGTSYSCPIVAGVAALLLSIRPELTPLLLYKVLTNTADKIGGYNYDVDGRCNETGYGRVNANNAVWAVCDTTFLQQETIAHVSRTVVGCDVLMEDDAVVFNSTLNIRARNATKIAKHFFVGYNSSLSIKKY